MFGDHYRLSGFIKLVYYKTIFVMVILWNSYDSCSKRFPREHSAEAAVHFSMINVHTAITTTTKW